MGDPSAPRRHEQSEHAIRESRFGLVEPAQRLAVVRRRRDEAEACLRAERARRAGYTNNKKYETDPQSMLYARAAADV